MIFLSFVLISCHSKDSEEEMSGDMLGIQKFKIDTTNYHQSAAHWPAHFGFGKKASPALIRKWDISIGPDGKGLPGGSGIAADGQSIYLAKCATCHGKNGYEGPYDHLVYREKSNAKTIGNYWPYATTLFDYIRRAMPYNNPGSLSSEEVYKLTAFLLYRNKIIAADKVIDAHSLPKIKMPARKLFVNDDRQGGPEVR